MDGFNISNNKRITYKSVKPNPLFLKWLQELYRDTAARGSNSQYSMKEAIKCLKRYPIPLRSGAECAILKGFGKKLCAYLDQKLKAHKEGSNITVNVVRFNNENLPSGPANLQPGPVNLQTGPTNLQPKPANLQSALANPATSSSSEHSNKPPKKKATSKRDKRYKPANRTGGSAILLALLNHVNENPDKLSLTKDELIERAQPLCEDSLSRPKPDSQYTAWSTMTRLVAKGLVNRTRHKKAEFSLTDEGFLLATELYNEYKDKPTTVDLMDANFGSFDSDPSTSTSKSDVEMNSQKIVKLKTPSQSDVDEFMEVEEIVEMPAGSFDIVLLIDKQETSGVTKKNEPTVTQFKKYDNLKHEYRHLKVGDFTWVARHRINGKELVLPYIVERKRMDDLGASIKDGRFHEQKFRLKKCGLANVIYLIENYGKNKHVGLPVQSLMQAIANTRVQSGFKVHSTDSLAGSVRFLAIMTKRLTLEYKDKTLKGHNRESNAEFLMTFSYFNKASNKRKTLTVTETFIKMLLQLKGMSVEKALAITDVYRTPNSLIEKYKECDQKQGETLLARLKYNSDSQNVGPKISKTLHQLFSLNHLL